MTSQSHEQKLAMSKAAHHVRTPEKEKLFHSRPQIKVLKVLRASPYGGCPKSEAVLQIVKLDGANPTLEKRIYRIGKSGERESLGTVGLSSEDIRLVWLDNAPEEVAKFMDKAIPTTPPDMDDDR